MGRNNITIFNEGRALSLMVFCLYYVNMCNDECRTENVQHVNQRRQICRYDTIQPHDPEISDLDAALRDHFYSNRFQACFSYSFVRPVCLFGLMEWRQEAQGQPFTDPFLRSYSEYVQLSDTRFQQRPALQSSEAISEEVSFGLRPISATDVLYRRTKKLLTLTSRMFSLRSSPSWTSTLPDKTLCFPIFSPPWYPTSCLASNAARRAASTSLRDVKVFSTFFWRLASVCIAFFCAWTVAVCLAMRRCKEDTHSDIS
jgi:hypothetical protein